MFATTLKMKERVNGGEMKIERKDNYGFDERNPSFDTESYRLYRTFSVGAGKTCIRR